MAKTFHARMIDNVAVEVIEGVPAGLYHPEVAALFVPVPPQVRPGWTRDGANWSAPAPAEPAAQRRLVLTPPEYLLLFTAQERIAIRAKAKDGSETGAIIGDFLALIEDPRLSAIDLTLPAVRDGHVALVTAGLLSAARSDEIARGLPA